MCQEQGIDNTYIAICIAASLLFTREGEEKMSPQYILTEISGFNKGGEDFEKIMGIYDMFEKKMSLAEILKEVKKATNTKKIV